MPNVKTPSDGSFTTRDFESVDRARVNGSNSCGGTM